jgi:NAD(P)-dependent dehydrogenase (short-subunit alcohol dehydrogenase family)
MKKAIIPYRRWVLITGCDSGFGYLAAKQLLDRGFGVIALCLTEQGCQDVSKGKPPSAHLQTIQCDVSRSDDLERLKAELVKYGDGKLWAVVNNAGIAIPGNADFLTLDDFRRVMEVNFFASVAITKFCIPLLKQSRGRIINISSTCGLVALATNAPYNSSKFALRAFTDTLRRELSVWGIHVALILPGVMKTPITEKYIGTLERKFREAQDDIRSDYGETYWQSVVENTAKTMSMMAGDPQQVVNAIIHAVEHNKPKVNYVLGTDGKLFYQLHKLNPWFADMLLNITGNIKPAALEDRGTRRIEFTALCPADEKTTWRHFIDELWLRGAGLTPSMMLENTGDETGNGATRWIPVSGKYGLREGITFTKYPEYFCYRVMDLSTSIFPVKYHQGRVDFLPWAEGKTRILWSIEYTPKTGAALFIKMLFAYIIPRYFKALIRKCNDPS